jgi:hypothetical protein
MGFGAVGLWACEMGFCRVGAEILAKAKGQPLNEREDASTQLSMNLAPAISQAPKRPSTLYNALI